MKVRSAHKHDVAKDILLILHGGLLLSPDAFAPDRLRTTVSKFWRLQRHSPPQLRRALKYLVGRGFIQTREEEGLRRLELTDKGRRKVARFELEDLAIPIPLKWDGRWRLILFDVPETKKSARNALSIYLRGMGLFKLQDSVWVHPYPVEKEIGALRHALDLTDHLHLIVAESIESDSTLKEHFHLN